MPGSLPSVSGFAVTVTSCLSLLIGGTSVIAQQSVPESNSAAPADQEVTEEISEVSSEAVSAENAQTALVHVRNRAAKPMAELLTRVFESNDSLECTVHEEADVLVVRGSQQSVAKAVELVRHLDRARRSVEIEVGIAITDAAEDSPSTLFTDKFQLTTLDETRALLQIGNETAVLTGTTQQFGSRGATRSYQRQSTGTLLEVTPRVQDNQILLSLTLEKSWLEHSAHDSEQDSEPEPSQTFTATVSTTLQLQPGQEQTIRAQAGYYSDTRRDISIRIVARFADADSESAQTSAADRPRTLPDSDSDSTDADADAQDRFPATAGTSAQRLFDRLDSNGDGVISDDEWEASPLSRGSLASPAQLTPEKFDSWYRDFVEQLRQRGRSRR